jgi:hypothetical protein
MKKKKEKDVKKVYKVDKVVTTDSMVIYKLVDDAGTEILSSSNVLFVAQFGDRLVTSGHSVLYSKAALEDVKGVLPFA